MVLTKLYITISKLCFLKCYFCFSKEMLIQRLGSNAHAFSMEVTHLAPPSVQLVPAKEYNGAPIGTSYDIRVYIGMGENYFKYIILVLIIK